MKPMLFNSNMVCAILDGRKTVTRRVVKPQHLRVLDSPYRKEHPKTPDKVLLERLCAPPCRPGDILYVRETWCDPSGTGWPILYKADMPMHWDAEDTETGIAVDLKTADYKWRPSIHMPREAARIFLRVTDVRVERLQEITEEQARAEGAQPFMMTVDVDKPDDEKRWQEMLPALSMFPALWDSAIKPKDRALYGWEANPWVWVIEFERISREEAITV